MINLLEFWRISFDMNSDQCARIYFWICLTTEYGIWIILAVGVFIWTIITMNSWWIASCQFLPCQFFVSCDLTRYHLSWRKSLVFCLFFIFIFMWLLYNTKVQIDCIHNTHNHVVYSYNYSCLILKIRLI